jgi:hypothetical protein
MPYSRFVLLGISQQLPKLSCIENKLTYRALAGVSAYPQVEDADSIEAALTKRAEIEALEYSRPPD